MTELLRRGLGGSVAGWVGIAASVLFAVAVLALLDWILVGPFHAGGGRFLLLRIPLPALVAIGAGGGILLLLGLLGAPLLSRRPEFTWRYCAAPLALSALCGMAAVFDFWIPEALRSNLLYFLPPALIAWMLHRVWLRKGLCDDSSELTGRGIFLISLAAWVLYSAIGIWFTHAVGEHSGDEGHYLVQAESLFRDGDLDIRNNVTVDEESMPDIGWWRHVYHVSELSRDEHWYSYHPIGLPLVLAPFVPGGIVARHAVLGAWAALGVAGMLVLCRVFRATRAASLLATALFSLSIYWGVYSSRCLPEVPGAALLLWCVAATFRQKERPWFWTLVAVVSAGVMLWMHMRFVPVSVAAIGFFLLTGFLQKEPIRQKIARLAVATAIYALLAGGLLAQLHSMFVGGHSHPFSVLFNYPRGMWLILMDHHSVTSVLPLCAALLGAAAYVLAFDRPNRAAALVVVALFLVNVTVVCSSRLYHGGATLAGRFVLIVVPLLVPCLARTLKQQSGAVLAWTVFLGMIGIQDFLLELPSLPSLNNAFANPAFAIPEVFPLLHGKVFPFDPTLYPTLFLPLVLLAVTAAVFLVPASYWRIQSFGIALILAAAVLTAAPVAHSETASDNAVRLARVYRQPVEARMLRRGNRDHIELFDLFDLMADRRAASVTTADLGERQVGRLISLPHVAPNDFAGRDYVWATLTQPFHVDKGRYAVQWKGHVEGNPRLTFAVRVGSGAGIEAAVPAETDGRVAFAGAFTSETSGDLYLLLRLEGQGSVRVDRIAVAPYHQDWQAVGVQFPCPMLRVIPEQISFPESETPPPK